MYSLTTQITIMETALIQQIEIAFTDVEYPGDRDITDSTYGEEPEALKREFIGKKDWRSLEPKFLDQAPEGWRTALSFFSDRAFHFYLPAYLIADLQGELREVCPEFHLCYGITPTHEHQKIAEIWGGGTVGTRARHRFDQFNTEQATTIIAYLQCQLSKYEDQEIIQALDNYWLTRVKN
jgi:hypothetical protein